MGKGGSVSDREETVMPEDAPGNPGAGRMEARPARQEAVYRPVREMQAKLHRWAGEDPSRRFGDLFNLVYDPDFLAEAWLRVKKNKGSRTPGIDGATVASIENRPGGVGVFLEHIRAALKSGEYRPEPVRQVMIPKKSGKLRKLGITTVADRVVQAALKLVLEPIFEADFQPCSYGFRPNRRAHDAIAEIHHYATHGYEWVLEADIRACFDEIGHVALMDRLRARIKVQRAKRKRHGLASWRLVRYADDFIVMVSGQRHHAEALREEVAAVLAPLGLRLAEEKTRVVHIDEGFDFLNVTIRRMRKRGTSKHYVYTVPSKKAIQAVKDKVSAKTYRSTRNMEPEVLIQGIN